MSKVFVIIVTYNGKQWYDRCFISLRTSKIPVQVVVIDNASSDDTVRYIQKNYPEIILLESDKNLGFGQGNNKAIRYAMDHGADYVFLLNQDAWIETNTLKGLVEIHKINSGYGILSPLHLNADKTSIEKGLMNYIADYKTTSSELINDLFFRRVEDLYQSQYINAAAWLLPRKTLETVGGFDPIFFHYGEDDNYMNRVHYHGYKIGICPKLTICHDTERQVVRNELTLQTNLKILLAELTDINRNVSILDSILYAFRKGFLKALRINVRLAKYYFSNGFYIIKMRNRILESKNQNRKVAPSWL